MTDGGRGDQGLKYDFDAGRLCGKAMAHRAESAWQEQHSRVPGMA